LEGERWILVIKIKNREMFTKKIEEKLKKRKGDIMGLERRKYDYVQ
jgi:hypothetical protein